MGTRSGVGPLGLVAFAGFVFNQGGGFVFPLRFQHFLIGKHPQTHEILDTCISAALESIPGLASDYR